MSQIYNIIFVSYWFDMNFDCSLQKFQYRQIMWTLLCSGARKPRRERYCAAGPVNRGVTATVQRGP